MLPSGSVKRVFDVNLPREQPLERGMSYGMFYGGVVQRIATVPPQQRQSLAQRVLVFREQNSHYLSVLRNFGLRPDYPAFHAPTLIRTAPPIQQVPRPGFRQRYGGLAQTSMPGAMGSRPRFKKALPTPANPFIPPIYGQGDNTQ